MNLMVPMLRQVKYVFQDSAVFSAAVLDMSEDWPGSY